MKRTLPLRPEDRLSATSLITDFVIEASEAEDVIEVFASPAEGVANALAAARPGDCLVLLVTTQRDVVVQLIQAFVTAG